VNLLTPENKITLKENICFHRSFDFVTVAWNLFFEREEGGAEHIKYKFGLVPKLPSICFNQ